VMPISIVGDKRMTYLSRVRPPTNAKDFWLDTV
jgi:hypothetical protein